MLKTPRLELRPPASADGAALAEAVGRYDVARWLIAKPYPFGRRQADAFIASAISGRSWLGWSGAELIGGVSVENGLAFWVARPVWGQGYASEMADAAVTAFFAASNEDKLLAGAMAGNDASLRVLERLNFAPLGPDRVWSEPLRQPVDVIIHRRTRTP